MVSLEGLPIELTEQIVTCLQLCDIASLRLASRILENKASQGCFNAFFRHKKVELTTATLQNLVQATGQGRRRGCLMRHCTITGIIRSDTPSQDESTEYVRLLAEAFRNLKQRSPDGGLASLCLRLAVGTEGELAEPRDSHSWREVWDTALRTFHVTMAALYESQLPLYEHLDVFGGLRGCSLACDAFLASAPRSASTLVFGSLKKLTASLSPPYKAPTEHPSEVATIEAEAPAQNWHENRTLQGILHMLGAMPELESLDLHWYHLRDSVSASPAPSTTHQESSSNLAVPRLKECSLRGVYTSESDLLRFLEAVRPATLTLTDVRLVSGTYASVFRYLTSPDSPVACYHLDDVHEGIPLVHFEVPGSSKFRYTRGRVGPSTLTRQAGHVKEAIHYRLPPGRPLGSGARMLWVKSKTLEFGPPLEGAYSFVALNSHNATAVPHDSDDD